MYISIGLIVMILLFIIDLYMDYKILKSQKNVIKSYEVIYCQDSQIKRYSYFIETTSINKASEKFYAAYPRDHYTIIKIN